MKMAKVIVEFDTKEKSLEVLMNGKSLENISSVEFIDSFDRYGFAMSII